MILYEITEDQQKYMISPMNLGLNGKFLISTDSNQEAEHIVECLKQGDLKSPIDDPDRYEKLFKSVNGATVYAIKKNA